MAVFYFIRHGQMDFTLANTSIYQDRGRDLLTLSELGRQQIKAAAQDGRLKAAQLILASPFGRALRSAAILSKELGLDIQVETDLHEWSADAVNHTYLPQDEAERRYQALTDNRGRHPDGPTPTWESAGQMKARVLAVLDQYKDYPCVIVVCHGTLMQYVLDIPHPENGQIAELEYD